MPLAIGIFLHILLDALWLDPETLWWPLFGWGFSAAGPETVSGYLEALSRNWWMWLGELLGLLYLAYLWSAAGLRNTEKRLAFLRTGRVDAPIDGDVTC